MTANSTLKLALAQISTRLRAPQRRSLSVLTYHSVGSESSVSASTSRASFARHLESVGRMPQMRFLDWNRKHLAHDIERACLVTFDDGYVDNFTQAAPVLAEYGVKALFFITTAFLEGEIDITHSFMNYRGLAPMRWEQIEKLLALGHSAGLHGHTHRNFGAMSPNEAEDELAKSISVFRHRLGFGPDSFAYPFGQFHHRRKDFVEKANAMGLHFVFTTDHRLARLDDLQESERAVLIPRLRIDAQDSAEIVAQKVNGAWDFVSALQRLRSCLVMRSLGPVVLNDR